MRNAYCRLRALITYSRLFVFNRLWKQPRDVREIIFNIWVCYYLITVKRL